MGELLTCYFLLIRVALVTGFHPFFACIDKVLVNLAATGMRSNVGDHITPAQTAHRRLCWRQYGHTIISQRLRLVDCTTSPWYSAALIAFRTGSSLVIDHQLQTMPAPIAAVMSGAGPCPMLTVCGDEQEKRVPAHRSSHRPRILLFESFFPVSQREQNLGGDRQMLTVHRLT